MVKNPKAVDASIKESFRLMSEAMGRAGAPLESKFDRALSMLRSDHKESAKGLAVWAFYDGFTGKEVPPAELGSMSQGYVLIYVLAAHIGKVPPLKSASVRGFLDSSFFVENAARAVDYFRTGEEPKTPPRHFRDLEPGDTFDFINPNTKPGEGTDFRRMVKTTPRQYRSLDGTLISAHVGSVGVEVFNVKRKGE